MDILVVNAAPFALALVVPTLGLRLGKLDKLRDQARQTLAWGLALTFLMLFAALLGHLQNITTNGPSLSQTRWVPELGLTLSLYLDGLSLLFALLITGVGAMVMLYAGYYFEEISDLTRFYTYLLIFVGGMLGLVLAGNLLTLFIGWEITSVASFLLISFKQSDPAARRGALQALIITAGGGLALLLGLILLGTAAGSFEFSELLRDGEALSAALRENSWYPIMLVLIVIGCAAKSAQFPLHFWLPDAMTAPTPASAYLHSATMVKAGIYLLARLYPLLGDSILWQAILVPMGLLTMLIGALWALRQQDLKGALAYSTISQLGALVALIGLPEGHGLTAAYVGIVAHALYKGALFLIVGAVDHAAGTRLIAKLGGLGKKFPLLAGITILAALSMAGLPPLLGFVAKEQLLESVLESSSVATGIVLFSALFTVTMALILVWDVFFGKAKQQHDTEHHGEEHHHLASPLLIAPGILATFGLLTGLFLQPLIVPLLTPALGKAPSLHLFHGFNTPLLLSIIAIAGGAGVFALRGTWRSLALPALPAGRDLYNAAVQLVERVADIVLWTQGGKLRYYLFAILCAVSILMATAGFRHIDGNMRIDIRNASDVLKGVLLILSLGATLASIIIRNHLVAALLLGVSGYSVGAIFLLEPAPDVALVQFLVETIGTVLVVIMLSKIRAPERQQVIERVHNQRLASRLRDVLIAVAVGVGVGLFSLAAVANRSQRTTITQWHLDNSLPLVGATDVVASIVTDFRGMDTVIEITVFSLAALGVLTIIGRPEAGKTWSFNRNGHAAEEKRATWEITVENESDLSTPLTRVVASLAVPFSLMLGLAHILYSGVATGDGFTAGVVAGLGVALWYIVFGYHEASRRLRWLHPVRLIGAGMGLAILNAAVPLLFGKPFLVTTQFDQLHLPAGIHLSSTTFFEIGIFLAVLGGTSLILKTIAHPKEVETL
ncbi:MAG: hydrogen gas-evolving membrane-bound hydrogenase subunit E [Anaerolineae bacterium]